MTSNGTVDTPAWDEANAKGNIVAPCWLLLVPLLPVNTAVTPASHSFSICIDMSLS
jgi:uncharacterized membrane protein